MNKNTNCVFVSFSFSFWIEISQQRRRYLPTVFFLPDPPPPRYHILFPTRGSPRRERRSENHFDKIGESWRKKQEGWMNESFLLFYTRTGLALDFYPTPPPTNLFLYAHYYKNKSRKGSKIRSAVQWTLASPTQHLKRTWKGPEKNLKRTWKQPEKIPKWILVIGHGLLVIGYWWLFWRKKKSTKLAGISDR
jgi:hypothetical protein